MKKIKLVLESTPMSEDTSKKAWSDFPSEIQHIILDLLSPLEALQYISVSKENLEKFGPYFIQQLRQEKNAYKIISLDIAHTLAMRKDGALFAWGLNNMGQLALGHNLDQNTPKHISKDHFQGKTIQSFITGYNNTFSLCTDGTLFTWGNNHLGQLGLGHKHQQNTPQRIPQEYIQGQTIQSIFTGLFYTLALCAEGALFAWGQNEYGQLGLGHTNNQHTPQLIDLTPFQDNIIQSIFTGENHILALCEDGALFAWGYNYYGQLGLGHNTHQSTPQRIDPVCFQGKTIQSIDTRGHNTLALCSDGTLFAWGDNHCGELGLGHTNNQNTPQLIDLTPFQGKTIQSIFTGYAYNLALREDGALFSWGANSAGQLGLGHTNQQNTPQQIDSNHFQDKTIQSIYLGDRHIVALCTDGTLFAWGKNNDGQLGLGHNDNQYIPQHIDPNHFQGKTIQSIITRYDYTLARSTDGSLFAWGYNEYGQLGLGHNGNELIPTQLPDPLERAFRAGHQKLNSNAFFSNTAVDPKSSFLSGCVLHPNETAQSRAEASTTGMANPSSTTNTK